MENLVIDHDGKLYMNVEHKLRLRVSVKFLTANSPVFKSMFSGRYSEGQQKFTTSAPGKVDFPEDNAEAMKMLCCALHLQYQHDFMRKITARKFYAVAVLADKYDCTVALSQVGFCWYCSLDVDMATYQQHLEVLAATYLLNLRTSFERLSKKLLIKFENHAESSRSEEVFEHLPGNFGRE